MAAEIAKLYANALFELFLESGSDDNIYTQMNEYDTVFRNNHDLIQLLSAPLLTSDEKQSVISKIFDDNGLVFDYLRLICDKGRAEYFSEITEIFNQKYNEYKNIADISVITSRPLNDDLKIRLIKRLENKLNKTIILNEKIDPDIIDGIIIEYNNKRLDSSVRSKLQNIKTAMTDADLQAKI